MKAAVYTGTRNLYPDMVPAVKSLLINSDVERVYLLIEDEEFPYYLPECVETIDVSKQQYFRPDGPNMKSRFTYMAMMRATLCHLFPDLDRILSMDVDTIVEGNISDVWYLPIDDCYFAASMEPLRTTKTFMYTNIGVCLYNLEKLRDGKADRVIQELNRNPYRWLEQDVMNNLCQGEIYDMPSEYNANNWVQPCAIQRIIHYAAIRQWNHLPPVQKYRNIPWSEIRGGL